MNDDMARVRKSVKAIKKKITERFPYLPKRDKKGVKRIAVDGENLCLGRDAREQLQDIMNGLKRMAGKKGTCRVERIVDGISAAQMVGYKRDDLDEEEDDLLTMDFIVPANAKDPKEEFGPAYVILFKEEK
jgi:hypothetical protein